MTEEIKKLIEEVGDKMVIYCWINIITKEQYIGQTKRFKKRTINHIRGWNKYNNGNKTLLSSSIEEYGLENFSLNILKICATQEELNQWEEHYIKELNSVYPHGFNLRKNIFDMPATKSSRQKSARSKQGIKRTQSNYVGVFKLREKYNASLCKDSKTHCKIFETEIEAAEAYDVCVLYLYGPNANLNFPHKRKDYLKKNLEECYLNFLEPVRPKTSKYKGVCLNRGLWRTCVSSENYNIPNLSIGSFTTEKEAALFADKLLFFYAGFDLEDLNFPEEMDKSMDSLFHFFQDKIKPIRVLPQGISQQRNVWTAFLGFNSKGYRLGTFSTQEEAVYTREVIMKLISKEETNLSLLKNLNLAPKAKQDFTRIIFDIHND